MRSGTSKVMLKAMINILLKGLVITLLFSSAASAGMYKGLDEEGNVVYSDKPFDEAKKFSPPPITVVDPPKVKPKEVIVEEEKPVEFKYTSLKILSPTNDQVIWNEPDLTVKLQLKPDLNTAEGHTTWLLMDGKPLVKNSRSLALQIGRSDRGEHQIQAQVRNKKGKILKRSQSVTIHIKNTVISR